MLVGLFSPSGKSAELLSCCFYKNLVSDGLCSHCKEMFIMNKMLTLYTAKANGEKKKKSSVVERILALVLAFEAVIHPLERLTYTSSASTIFYAVHVSKRLCLVIGRAGRVSLVCRQQQASFPQKEELFISIFIFFIFFERKTHPQKIKLFGKHSNNNNNHYNNKDIDTYL